MKKYATEVAMALLMAGALGALGCSRPAVESGGPAAAKPGDSSSQAPAATTTSAMSDGVVVYYFHGDRRCRTCLGIQKGIDQAVRERFAAELAAGKLEFREVNFDQDANKAIALQFQISFSSMIVAWVKGGKIQTWENCEKVWDFAHEPPRLMDYVEERIRAFLAKPGAP
jgi:hypothetical protein